MSLPPAANCNKQNRKEKKTNSGVSISFGAPCKSMPPAVAVVTAGSPDWNPSITSQTLSTLLTSSLLPSPNAKDLKQKQDEKKGGTKKNLWKPSTIAFPFRWPPPNIPHLMGQKKSPLHSSLTGGGFDSPAIYETQLELRRWGWCQNYGLFSLFLDGHFQNGQLSVTDCNLFSTVSDKCQN